jgi:peptidase E
MNVLRHHHVPHNNQTIAPAHAFEDLEDEITAFLVVEQPFPLVTAKRDEVQITRAIEAMEG